MFAPYRRLFALPHVPSLLFWSLCARLQIGGLPIAVTFLVAGWTGSYALAGLVAGGLTVGTAVAGPVRGRLADRRSKARLMLSSAAVYGTGLLVLALLPAALWWAAVPLALATGLFQPPATQIARSIWPRLTHGPMRQTMFAAEATLQELLFIAGPLLAAATVALGGGRLGVAVMAVLPCLGAAGFAYSLRRAGLSEPAPAEEPDHARGGAPVPGGMLLNPRAALVLTMTALLALGLGAMDLTMVAFSRELGSPGYAGGLMAVYAAGSAAGGLLAGTFTGPPRPARRALGTAAGAVVLVPLLPPLLHLPSPWLLTPVLLVAGLAIAPTIAAVTERMGDAVPARRRGEAYGWLASALTGGISVAGPTTGWLIDTGGVAAGAAGAAAATALAALAALGLGPAAPTAAASPTTPGAADPPTDAPPPAGPPATAE
ncbi:transporter [Streptomonospora alba]|uniref:Transporter n=1 Tax=Streptomonospora alba TaxID=183763 RepID=A0A0C2FCQ8_9ACTN|nr:MFS transporter [Streptomonospora alba]KIH96954.1 transporter [Streptomonospora alba]